MIFMPNASPIAATCEPIFPKPRMPSVVPARSLPTDVCQPPALTDASRSQSGFDAKLT